VQRWGPKVKSEYGRFSITPIFTRQRALVPANPREKADQPHTGLAKKIISRYRLSQRCEQGQHLRKQARGAAASCSIPPALPARRQWQVRAGGPGMAGVAGRAGHRGPGSCCPCAHRWHRLSKLSQWASPQPLVLMARSWLLGGSGLLDDLNGTCRHRDDQLDLNALPAEGCGLSGGCCLPALERQPAEQLPCLSKTGATKQAGWLQDHCRFMGCAIAMASSPFFWGLGGFWPNPWPAMGRSALRSSIGQEADALLQEALLQWHLQTPVATNSLTMPALWACKLIGDLPFLTCPWISADVWRRNRQLFSLRSVARCSAKAVFPPDYFSDSGQLWGSRRVNRWWRHRAGRLFVVEDGAWRAKLQLFDSAAPRPFPRP